MTSITNSVSVKMQFCLFALKMVVILERKKWIYSLTETETEKLHRPRWPDLIDCCDSR